MLPIRWTIISTPSPRRWRCRSRMPGGRRCGPISKYRCGWRGWSTNSRCPTKPSRPVSLQPDRRMTANPTDCRPPKSRRPSPMARCRRSASPRRRWRASPNTITILNSFTDVTADRARAKARAVDAAIADGQNAGPLAGVPFAVKNLFDVAGPADPRRLEDQPRPAAVAARRHPDRAAGSGRRGAGRRAQHGRIRLRLHRRERP